MIDNCQGCGREKKSFESDFNHCENCGRILCSECYYSDCNICVPCDAEDHKNCAHMKGEHCCCGD